MNQDKSQRWWCTPCQKWIFPLRGPQIGAQCPVCRSGKIRPPKPGEDINP